MIENLQKGQFSKAYFAPSPPLPDIMFMSRKLTTIVLTWESRLVEEKEQFDHRNWNCN